jgi:hypothetical protein
MPPLVTHPPMPHTASSYEATRCGCYLRVPAPAVRTPSALHERLQRAELPASRPLGFGPWSLGAVIERHRPSWCDGDAARGEVPEGRPDSLALRVHAGRELGPVDRVASSGVGGAVSPGGPGTQDDLDDLLWRHITQVVEPALLHRVVEFFGLAFVRGVTTFTLLDLVNELGIAVFEGGRVSLGGFRLMTLFRPADPAGSRDAAGSGGAAVAFRHAAYQELLAAEFLRTAEGRAAAVAAASRPRLTEQLRQFLCHRGAAAAGTDDCVLPAGVYVVGPGHHLMLRRTEQPVRLDRFPVTVRRYKRFLDAIAREGSAHWDHPAMPAGLHPRAVARTAPAPRLLRRSCLRQPPSGRGQLVERLLNAYGRLSFSLRPG